MILKSITPSVTPMRKNLFRLAFVGLSLVCAPVKSAPSDAQSQVENIVRKSAQSEIKQLAQTQGWGKYDVQLETVIPQEASALAACQKPLVVSPVSKRLLYRLRYEVKCPAAQDWTLTVAVKTAVNVPVLVAAQTLERGQVIAAADVVMRVQDIAPLNGQFFNTPEEVLGQTVKRRISASQVVNVAQLEQPVMVERGQSVLMVARHQGIEASTTGEAMKQGRKGDVIRVRNISSQRTVDAIVVSPGVVQILTVPGK
ncbi:flagellar basal body P-ring formation chaperone FlgA [Buttiauxella sp.]|uniref:flagellar basal body P-ring formation chaperone FlgA n=1 Tax=Buttiauxella sp. TaxID=1972222 RepID=UPI003C71763E